MRERAKQSDGGIDLLKRVQRAEVFLKESAADVCRKRDKSAASGSCTITAAFEIQGIMFVLMLTASSRDSCVPAGCNWG